jgi:hypothetical protein
MIIEQKRFSNKCIFEFLEDYLRYTIREKGNETTYNVTYDSIKLHDFGSLVERNTWYRNAGLLWVAIGIIFSVIQFLQNQTFAISIWIWIGLLCLTVFWFTKSEFSTLQAFEGTLYVIKDKKHDQIIEELKERRRSSLFTMYGLIDYTNDFEEEIEKFRWLLQEKSITKEHFEEVKTKIKKIHGEI